MKEYCSPIHQSTLYIAEDLFKEHEATFLAYVEIFCVFSDEDIASQSIYKKEHTLRVVEFAKMLAIDSSEFFLYYPILLSALYHDIGRFEQYMKFKTFKDDESCNHGHFGVKIAKKFAFLASESPKIKQYVYTAIALHNNYILPKLPIEIDRLLKIIRDADRLDIINNLSKLLSSIDQNTTKNYNTYAKDIPNKYNPKVLQTLEEKKMVLYSDIIYYNDLRLMIFSWYCNFSTESATNYIKESSILQNLYADLPKTQKIDDICIPLLS